MDTWAELDEFDREDLDWVFWRQRSRHKRTACRAAPKMNRKRMSRRRRKP